ncbi:MAG: AAA family ATPase [Bacilli bacterium]|nr:AAA family ATPase [Bacilli bacterium]
MLTRIRVKNFQSLVNLDVDLMKTKLKPKKLVVIYGENGVGKTNFSKIFHMINQTTRTMMVNEIVKRFLNDEKNDNDKIGIDSFISTHLQDTKNIIKKYKTIDSKDNMSVELGFIVKNQRGSYFIEYDNEEIVSESLDFVINKNQVNFFKLNKANDKIRINDKIFLTKEYIDLFKSELEKYWGKHSFVSILNSEMENKTKKYILNNISKDLLKATKYLESLCIKVKSNNSYFGNLKSDNEVLHKVLSGEIPINKEDYLDKTENMLNTFFTRLYSDIKQVFYEKKQIDNKIKYKLYAKKLIYGKIINLDFSLESSGTQNLLELIPYLLLAVKGEVVIIDEFDDGIHDVLIYNLLKNLKEYIKGQLIITTHNTILLESLLKKEDIYIFSVNRNAEKELVCLTEFGERDHKNFNLRKRYLSGIYTGTPFVSDIDFKEISNYLDGEK